MIKNIDFLLDQFNFPDASQVGIVVRDVEKAKEFYRKNFNFKNFVDLEFPFTEIYYYGKLVKSIWKMSFYSLGSIELEIVQPVYGPSVHKDFLIKKGEGIHHIGFDIDNIDEKIENLRRKGISVLQSQKCKGAHSAYLDTEKDCGMMIELIQRKERRAK